MAYDERNQLDQRIDYVTKESVDSTKRMRAMVEETRQMGVETVTNLNKQGEQLDNVERQLDEIDLDLNQTDINLKELEKCCGCFTCICCAPKDMTKTKQYNRAFGDKAQKPVVTSQPRGLKGNSSTAQGPFIKRVTDDDRENEMEDNLQYVTIFHQNMCRNELVCLSPPSLVRQAGCCTVNPVT